MIIHSLKLSNKMFGRKISINTSTSSLDKHHVMFIVVLVKSLNFYKSINLD